MLLGTFGTLFIVWCYFIIKKHKSNHHDAVSLRYPCGSDDVIISEKEEVDCDVTNRNYENLANVSYTHLSSCDPMCDPFLQAPTNPTNTRDTTLQPTAAVQSPHDSSSVQIPSPPSSPKLEEAVADPKQNPLVCASTLLPSYYDDNLLCLQTSTQTLPSDYKSDNVVIGFDSSHEVMPSELSTTANSEQALLGRDHVIHALVTLYTIKLFVFCSPLLHLFICIIILSK